MSRASSLSDELWDVAVIGAGVAGSVAAARCADAGLRTLLLERQRFPRFKVCGCCLNRRAIEMLKRAGDRFRGLEDLRGTRTSALSIRCGRRRLDLSLPEGMAISRRALDRWLVDRAVAAGCRFQDNVTATVEPFDFEFKQRGERMSSRRLSANSREANPAERTILLRLGNGERESIQTPADQDRPQLSIAESRVRARVVLACDGLGHPSLQGLTQFQEHPRPGSRIGLGAIFPRDLGDADLPEGVIQMAIAPFGYAGLVQVEREQWNLAAAVDPAHLRQTRSPVKSIQAIFAACDISPPRALHEASIKGTAPLTRRTEQVAGHRLFLLGDATGYVEPFSGEGMAWALAAATSLTPLVVGAITAGWSKALIDRWQRDFNAIVRREQRVCGWLTAALRQTWLLTPLMVVTHAVPAISRGLIRRIHRLPTALELNS